MHGLWRALLPERHGIKRHGFRLRQLRGRFRHTVWLNPSRRPDWGAYWTQTYDEIAREFPMFPLTVDGLEEGMKKLLSR